MERVENKIEFLLCISYHTKINWNNRFVTEICFCNVPRYQYA